MRENNLFYRYYDAIFRDKDYTEETHLVFQLSKRFGLGLPRKMLEIGCGTGNHTQELARYKIPLVAIDIDRHMVAIARQKINQKHVRVEYTPIEDLKERGFDLAIAMFNVVTYIPTIPKLISFMNAVVDHLQPCGVFIFDCWNGVAAIKNPPRVKRASVEDDGKTISYTLTPITNFFNQKTTLTYDIVVQDGRRIKKDHFSFTQTLWTPMQIQWTVQQAGLKVCFCSPFMKIDKPATEDDWKIMFCCQRPLNTAVR